MKEEYTEEEVKWASNNCFKPCPVPPSEMIDEKTPIWEGEFQEGDSVIVPGHLTGELVIKYIDECTVTVELVTTRSEINHDFEKEMVDYRRRLDEYNKIQDIRKWKALKNLEDKERKLLAELKQKYEGNN